MSEPRYIIELAHKTTPSSPLAYTHMADIVLKTTDPVEAVAIRDHLKGLLSPDYAIALAMEETSRSKVLAAMNEDHFRRPRPDRSAAVALAVETPGAAPGFDVAMNEAAAAAKSLIRLDNWLAGDAGIPDAREWNNIADTLDHYELVTPYLRSYTRRGFLSGAEAQRILLELSTLVRGFPIEQVEPVDSDRWLAVCKELAQHGADALSKPDAKACQAEAELDFLACKGRIVEVTFVNGYRLGTNDQNDLVTTAGEEPPFRVVVCAMDDIDTQWCDDTLDPKWDLRPAPDEDRLDGLRSLWTFGPSYRDATLSQQEG